MKMRKLASYGVGENATFYGTFTKVKYCFLPHVPPSVNRKIEYNMCCFAVFYVARCVIQRVSFNKIIAQAG